jgi:type I restriction enzyme R subunit
MTGGTTEAFSRVHIDAQIKDEGWDVQNPTAVRYEYLVQDGTSIRQLCCCDFGFRYE